MIKYVNGDMFSEKYDCIVNAVNCVGVMGKGLALQFKEKYPDNFRQYEAACKDHKLKPGGILVCRDGDQVILNAATKDHWKDPSQERWVSLACGNIAAYLKLHKDEIKTVALPKLGCGLGGLDWNRVRPIMERILCEVPQEIKIYLPGLKNKEVVKEMKKPKLEYKDTQRRVIIAGSGEFHDSAIFDKRMELYFGENTPKVIINDGTSGTAQLARNWAKAHDIPVFTYRADWKQFGQMAGHNRALRMLENADAALIFHAEGDRATEILLEYAVKAKIPVRCVKLMKKVPEVISNGENIVASAIRQSEEKQLKEKKEAENK